MEKEIKNVKDLNFKELFEIFNTPKKLGEVYIEYELKDGTHIKSKVKLMSLE